MHNRELEGTDVDLLVADIHRLGAIHQGALDDIAFAATNTVWVGRHAPDAPGSFCGRAHSRKDAAEHGIKWRLEQLPRDAIPRLLASPSGIVRRLATSEIGRRGGTGAPPGAP